ncbi:MAG: endonuclease/exonuclease/phosphatase family protein [Clostridia bacterium]|nr:endonuclease/exonuclease/phosphatase family protein [Clostridia bacterium]
MKIMSINLCCWGSDNLSVANRKERVKCIVEKYKPELIGVQEATTYWMQYLKNNLTDYFCVGIGRDENGTGEAMAIFYNKNVFDLKESKTFWLSETPDVVSKGWDGNCKRTCTKAVLVRLSDGKEFVYFNTHLDHVGTKAQLEGVKLINKEIEKYSDSPVILTGDFNVKPSSEAYKNVILKDTRVLTDYSENIGTWHNFGKNSDADAPIIDYCFINDNITALSYKVITDKVDGEFVTDHYPVLVETAD